MLSILNSEKYDQHLKARTEGAKFENYELILSILLFGSIGAITWAIRGTAGWGGVDGTIVPGLMWGVLWYYLAYRKGVDARGVVLWLGLGIALGGELGYGQYTGWIRGIFYYANGTIPIDPWLGYFWFAMCGIGWAAPGGILLGWALGERVSTSRWVIRSIILAILLVLLFAWPFVDWLGEFLLRNNFTYIFPNAELGIYTSELGNHLGRTVYTNTQNFGVVVWWIIALLEAAYHKDKTTLVAGLIIGGGFGFGFMQSAMWALGYGIAPTFIDWWKLWELNSGFNLGILYAITFYWAIENMKTKDQSVTPKNENSITRTKFTEWKDTLFLALGGFIIIFFVGFEYFFWTGLAISIFYLTSMSMTTFGDDDHDKINEKRKNVSLIFSIFFLLFMMFHGGSERFGIVFGLYSLDEVSQYSWPLLRIIVFLPAAIIISALAIVKMWNVLSSDTKIGKLPFNTSLQSIRMIDLMTVMGFIGVLSIWPAKISVFYALFLVLAIYAFNRLNYKFDLIDNEKQ